MSEMEMTMHQLRAWLKRQGRLDTLQELYAITIEFCHGLDAVKAWLDGKETYNDPDLGEVRFLMPPPALDKQE